MRPSLRPDLEFIRTAPQQFLLQDPANGAYFELGVRERFLADQMNGQRDSREIAAAFRDQFHERLSKRWLEEFIEQLRTSGLLLEPGGSTETLEAGRKPTGIAAGGPPQATAETRPAATRVHPLSADDPGGTLNHYFDQLALLLGWTLEIWCLLPVAALAWMGANVLIRNWDQFYGELGALTDRLTLPGLALAWIALVMIFISLPTALAMGMACRRFGGRVYGFGLRFHRGLVPYFFTDIGDSLLLMSTRGRWTLLLLGSLCRVISGSLALIGWNLARPDSALATCCLLLIAPSILGLALRLSVFVPMDAYFMLSFWTEEIDLRERALSETAAWLTMSRAPEALTTVERLWFRVFGLGIYAWNIVVHLLVIGGGGWLLTNELGGVGALIGATLVVWWYHEEIGEWIMSISYLRWIIRGGGKWYIRWPLRLIVLAAIVACGFIPYKHEVGGEFRLVPAAEYGLRAQIPSEIARIAYREGDQVEAGAVVVTLAAREQRTNVDVTRAELERAKAQLDLLKAGTRQEKIEKATQEMELAQRRVDYYAEELARIKDLANTNTLTRSELENAQFEYDSAEKMLAASREELAELKAGPRDEEIREAEAEVNRLKALLASYEDEVELAQIKSPIAGQIVTANVERRTGQYVHPGDLIAVVQDTSELRVEIAATEDAAVLIQPGQEVKLRMWGLDGELLLATVQRVASSAVGGSELAVDGIRTDRESLAQNALARNDDQYVRVYAQLEEPPGGLLPELAGYARVVVDEGNFWQAVARPIVRFFRVDVWSWLP